ncbi:MAG TPA: SAM-dependent methyltransferase, partial [Nocardioides sp.]|nr:SAM-dependent methyltransferase [Nocardioides sp.]
YAALTRDGILRERLADTLTDALRAELLRGLGYRVDVVQFVESAHTPRNTMIRAVRVTGRDTGAAHDEYDALTAAWGVRPRLGELLARTGAP